MQTVICPYCDKPAPLVTGKQVYPYRRDLWKKKFYLCRGCDAYVGCHPKSERPLGVPANKALRKLRRAAHDAFDPLWRHRMRVFHKRSHAYKWLAESLFIKTSDCHIGQFNEQQCEDTIRHCKNREETNPNERTAKTDSPEA